MLGDEESVEEESLLKKLLLLTMLLLPAVPMAGEKKQPPPNPADYPLTLHVYSSHMADLCAPGCICVQHLNIVMGKLKYELSDTISRSDLLRVGDYKARILKDETDRSYEYQRKYEFLLPDGATREYLVVAESE